VFRGQIRGRFEEVNGFPLAIAPITFHQRSTHSIDRPNQLLPHRIHRK
jgi:hypothetical protein